MVTDGATTKTLTVSPLQITGTDAAADTVSGLANAAGDVHIWVRIIPNEYQAVATADGSGNWTADFNGQPDLRTGHGGYAEEYDPDGDRTHVGWWIPDPAIRARPAENRVEAVNWADGVVVVLTIDDLATPQHPDYG